MSLAPVYLFSGDEYLVRRAADKLVEAHVPESARDFNLVVLDGAASDAATLASHLAQVPMFPGVKLVVVHDTTLLASKSDLSGEVHKALGLLKDGRVKDATRRFLAVLAQAGWSLEDLGEAKAGKWKKDLGVEKREVGKETISQVVDTATEEGWDVPESETETLERLLEGGAPGQNVLVLTCEKPDRRLGLTRLIEDKGVHETLKAEQRGRSVDTLDLGAVTEDILAEYDKRLDRRAEIAIKRALGGEMRLVAGELTKLCLFVGDRDVITEDDVRAVGVSRVREEAFWELGSAVVGRSLPEALFYADDAFAHRRHPIPMVASIASALRRAMQVRTAADRAGVRRGTRQLPDQVVDAVAAVRPGRKPHPFALLKEWERSLAWPSTQRMAEGLVACRDTDQRLKTSAGDPRLLVERLLITLCE